MKQNIILLLVSILISAIAYSQKIEGLVYDIDTGAPLMGVNIVENGMTNGTVTDVNGNFSFTVTNSNAEIVFSYLGYTTLSRKLRQTDFEGVQKYYLHPAAHQLGEVVLRGFDNNEKSMDIPATIGVVSSNDIKNASSYGLMDAFNNIAGVRIESQEASNTRISIRSSGYRAGFGLRNVKVYYDNIPLTEASGFTWLGGIQPSMLQGAEIIKGPGSSLYGSGTAGVVLLKSPQPYQTSVAIQSTLGSFNLSSNTLKAHIVDDISTLGVVYNETKTDGYRQQSNDDSRSILINGKSNLSNTINKVSWLLLYKDQDSQLAGPLNLEGLETDREAANPAFVRTNSGRDQQQLRLGLSFDFNLPAGFKNKTSLFASTSDFEFVLPPFLMFAENRNYGLRSQFESPYFLKSTPTVIKAGVEYQDSELRNVRYANMDGSLGNQILDIKEDSRQTNLFVQIDSELSDKLRLQMGTSFNLVRFNTTNFLNNASEQDLDFNTNISPRIALSYLPNSHLAIHGSVSTGFSPPSAQETRLQNGTINTGLNPEIGTNFQLDVKGFAFDHKVNYDVSLFHYVGNDELVNLTLSDNTTVTRNASETTKTGIEINLSYLIYENATNWFQKALINTSSGLYDYQFQNYTLVDGTSFDGNRITGAPEQEVNVGLQLEFAKGFAFSGQYKYVGDIPLNDGNTVFADSYNTFDFSVSNSFDIIDKLELTTRFLLNNAFDEDYNSFFALNASAPPPSPAFFYPAYERNFQVSVGLRYNFK